MQNFDLTIIWRRNSDLEQNAFFKKYTQGIKELKLFENDDRLYFSNKEKGIDFVFIDNILSSVHLFGKGHKEYSSYEGVLPFNIKISDKKQMVYEKFGSLEVKKGGGEVLPILGKSNEWGIFNINGSYFRFEFKEEQIVLITLSPR